MPMTNRPSGSVGMSGPISPELDFLLEDTAPETRLSASAPWRVLIVDDDESVHSISRVVLSDVSFQGRGVEILSAFSGRQAARCCGKAPMSLSFCSMS